MLEKNLFLSSPLPVFQRIFFYGKGILLFFCCCFLMACGSNLAPVSEVRWQEPKNRSRHVVQRGETLFAIAFLYDTDSQHLAALNHLHAPYALKVGQVLQLKAAYPRPAIRQLRPKIAPQLAPRSLAYKATHAWLWPVRGRVLSDFSPTQGKKGINIACSKGDKILASAAGVVAYAGSGLSGYGNLIIIKHGNDYLTAYGNNSSLFVAEGQKVKAGQVIAQAGLLNRQYFGVHFEIRKRGVPVNPLNYL